MRLKFFNDNDLLLIAFWLIITFLLFSTIGCISKQKCLDKYPPTVETITNHTKEIIIKDSLLQGATVYNTIYKDSIAYYPAYQWRVIKDTSGLAELRIMKDAMGNIIAECVAKDRNVEKTHVNDSTDTSTTKTNIVEKKVMPIWGWLIIGGLVIMLLKKYLTPFFKLF